MTTGQATTQTKQQIWAFDPAHTMIEFSIKHMMFTTVRGRFNEFHGTIAGSTDDPRGATCDVTIQATSIDTGNEQRDQHLRSADFLDVETYPTITFKTTRVEEKSENHFSVFGDLTIRDQTKEVELDVALNGIGQSPWGQKVASFTAETIITRQDWGLTWNVALEQGGVLVGNTAKISIEIEAIPQEQGQEAEASSGS